MILLQAAKLGSFLLMVFMGAVLIVGLPTLTTLFKALFHKYIPQERLAQRPFYYKTLSSVMSVGLAVGVVVAFLAVVFIVFG